MDTKRLRLTGPWMGRYNYVSRPLPPVAFNAVLEDDGGDISGETIEPNSFADQPLDSLMAGIIGVREGTIVRFCKTYSDFDAPKIDYEGRIDAKFTRVDGKWSFPNAPWQHGTFVLIRDAVGADGLVQRTRVAGEAIAAPKGRDLG
ncbi:MAG: hypothetical protein AAGA15_06680 [Pseudomonadota bacterium]